MFRQTSQCLLTAAFTFFLTAGAACQDLDQVNFFGNVTDIDGSAVVGAKITVTSEISGANRSVTSDSSGRYRIIELPPGIYSISAWAEGFALRTRAGLVTQSGQGIQINFELAPAGVRAKLNVSVSGEEAPLIDTTRTVFGTTLSETEIEETPNESRDALDLVLGLGGVTEEPLSTRDLSLDRGGRDETAPRNSPEEVGVFAVSGGTGYSNNITIDGFDNNDDRVASFRFQPPVDAIKEIQVITNQFSAEYGRASGGRVNILTKPGRAKFGGRFYKYFRDDRVNANSWSNNRRGVPRPRFTQSVPGFTLTGPIPIGNFKRTFFYFAFEYDHIFESAVTDTWVPIIQNPLFPIPLPTSGEIITDWPDDPSLATDLGRYLQPVSTPRRRYRSTARIDHNFSERNYFTFNYQLGKTVDKRQFNGGNRLAEALTGKIRTTHALNFTYNSVISENAVNQFRLQYSLLKPSLISDGQSEGDPVVLIAFREPGRRSNTTLVAGSSTLGASSRREIRWQVQETYNRVIGPNTLRLGLDLQRIDSTHIDLTDATGTFNFSSPLSTTTVPQCLIDPANPGAGRIRSGAHAYARGCVQRYRQRFFTGSNIANTYFALFVQDEWRARDRLSMNFGLRYERESVISDGNNFGPRFAVAWSPFKGNNGVIRFGAGIFYNRVLLRTVDDYQRGTNELVFDTNRVSSSGHQRDPFLLELSNRFPGTLSADSPLVRSYVEAGLNENGFFRSLDEEIKIPESYQVSLGFEYGFGNSMVFEANLTLNRTTRLWRETNTNAPAVPTGFSDLADYLATGITTGSTRFEFAGIDAPDSRVDSGITFYNLDSQNPSTAASTPYGRALAIADTLRPRPGVGQTEKVGSLGNSLYRGLVLKLNRRFREIGGGFRFSTRFAYTLSFLEDDGIVNTSSAQTPGDFSAERARSLLDRRHRIAVAGLLVLPGWLGGFTLAPVFRFGSGAPFNISNGGSASDDRNLDDVNTDRPNYSGDLSDLKWRRMTDPVNNTVLGAITLAAIGRAGNLPRNAGTGPRQYVFDLNLSRKFELGRLRIRPQVEFGNILNMTVYSFGSEFIDASTFTDNPDRDDLVMFLAPTRAYRPRKIRFGIRFDF